MDTARGHCVDRATRVGMMNAINESIPGADILAQLLEAHRGLVVTLARQVWRDDAPMLEVDDLVQEGLLALMEAAADFDPDAGVPFGAYAGQVIRWRLLDAIEAAAPVRVPHRQRLQFQNAARALADAGAPVTVDAIAAQAGMARETVERLWYALLPVESLDAPAYAEGDDATENIMPSPTVLRPTEDAALEAIEEEAVTGAVETALETLPARDEVVIRRLFGIGVFVRKTQQEIARLARLAQATVSRILARFRAALRAALSRPLAVMWGGGKRHTPEVAFAGSLKPVLAAR